MPISFKSVGDLAEDRKFAPKVNEIPIGIKTPLSMGQSSDGILSMHYKVSDQIQDNFRNLLLTNWGERLAFYDFGANLRNLTFELSSEDFDMEAMRRIKRATSKWMPFIELLSFEKEILGRYQDTSLAQIRMKVEYAVPKLGITNKAIELTFYIGG